MYLVDGRRRQPGDLEIERQTQHSYHTALLAKKPKAAQEAVRVCFIMFIIIIILPILLINKKQQTRDRLD